MTTVCGFLGFAMYLLSDNSRQSEPIRLVEGLCGYLLIWPVLLVQKIGGVNPVHYSTKWEPVKTVSWLATYVYYYCLVAIVDQIRRKSRRNLSR